MTNEMTAEEAIKILNDIDFCNGNVCDSCHMGYRCSDIHKVKTMAIKALEAQPSEDCIKRQAVLDVINFEDKWLFDANGHNANTHIAFSGLESRVKALPSVTPKYTDEEIDKAQAVEQAYVDKMVELAVEETKERYSDAIEKMKKTIDEMTEIHSDGEFYIKNVDAKWIISKYLCGAEMGGADETN